MMKTMLAPSLMVGNLLNIQADLREIEKTDADMLHIDMMDPTMAKATGLPNALLPELRKASGLPLDIHIASGMPESYLDSILPHCRDCYVSVHIETTDSYFWIADRIRQAGAKPGVALNSSTPAAAISQILPAADMVMILTFDAGRSLNVPGTREPVCAKIAQIRAMCESIGRPDMLLECDGGITFEDTRLFRSYGADVFVLGRDSIYAQPDPISEKLRQLREYLKD